LHCLHKEAISYKNLSTLRALTPLSLCVFARNLTMTENELSKHIVNAAYKIHTSLGPGLLESVYEMTLMPRKGAKVQSGRRKGLRVWYVAEHMRS